MHSLYEGPCRRYRKPTKCQRCGKYKRVLCDINGELVCLDCLRGIAFYKVLREGFRDPRIRGDILKVSMDVASLVWGNPIARAWLWPLVLWFYSRDIGMELTIEVLERSWRFKPPLEEVFRLYMEERIFNVVEEGGKRILVEGEALQEMLQKYRDRSDLYDIVTNWAFGFIIARLHEEPSAPDFRYVYAVLKSIGGMITEDGKVKAEPYYRVTGYRCKLCGKKTDTREEMRRHLMRDHLVPTDEMHEHIEVEKEVVGYLLEVHDLIKSARREHIRPEYLIERIEKGGAVVPDDPDIPRFIEKDGRRYLVVSPAWIRVLIRTREYERELTRGRFR